jgi:hypothetical protein
MGDSIRLFDFLWIPSKCWDFTDSEEPYFGSDYNASGVLRFTTLIDVRYNEVV